MRDWKIVKLGDVFDLQMGKTPDRKNLDFFSTTDNKWISIADISKSDKYIFETKEYISDEAVKKSGIKQIPANTVIMSFKLSIGKTAITKEPMYSNEAIMAFLPNGKYDVDNDFLYHLFSNKDWTEGSNKAVKGITLNKASLLEAKILLPPLTIQKQIAKVMDKCTEIISKNERMLENYDSLIKSRFIEMFGDIRNQEKYKGIPLSNLCKTMTGGTPPTSKPEYYEGTIPWITTVSLGPNHIDGKNAKGYITEEAIKNSATKLIPVGNILFGTRVGVGKSSINDVDICTNQDIIALIGIDESRYSKLFIKHVIDQYQPYFDSIKKGATILGITTDDVKKSLIPDVSLSLQKEFENFVQQIDKSKFAVQKSLEKAETLYKSLMQEYFV